MRKIIYLLMMVVLVGIVIAESNITTNVLNSVPTVLDIGIVDESVDPGIQINEAGSRIIEINATVQDMNSMRQIFEVKAFITGPSVIEESPINLVNITNTTGLEAVYNGSFMLNGDDAGIYSVNITVNDSLSLNYDNISFEYIKTPVLPKNITVCGSGCNYTSIQEAVNNATDGEIVYIFAGTYNEWVNINKSNIKIIGEDRSTVILNGDTSNSCLILKSVQNVSISGLTIQNHYQGVYLNDTLNITLDDVVSKLNKMNGIVMLYSIDNHISNCEFSESDTGTGMWIEFSDNNQITSIQTANNNESGIYMYQSSDNQLRNIISYGSKTYQGLSIWKSHNNIYENISAYGNRNNGMYLELCNNSLIKDSNLSDNIGYHGLSMTNCSITDITNVNVIRNNMTGIYVWYSSTTRLLNLKAEMMGSYGALFVGREGVFINNSEFKINYRGIGLNAVDDILITDNIITENSYGISSTSGITNLTVEYNYLYANIICDHSIDGSCQYDYTPPANITDLNATPGGGDKQIQLQWTAPGDNMMFGSVSSYTLKYALTPVNDSNWDTATTYDTSGWSSLQSGGNPESRTVDMPDYQTYWFAIRAEDDDGLDNNISNSDDALSPYHSIIVESMECINLRTGYKCNVTSGGTYPSTNYFYDTFNISGEITNNGNLNETKDVEARLDGVTKNSKNMLFESNKTTPIDIQFELNDVNEENHWYTSSLYLNGNYKEQGAIRIWWLKEHTEIDWDYASDYPNAIESADTPIYIAIRMKNNNTLRNYYDFPTKLNINTSYEYKVTDWQGSNSAYVSENNLTSYQYISTNTALDGSSYFWWLIDGLPVGSYNISIIPGIYDQDRPSTITRIVNVE
ncbi:MAG: right-handed parallel beta-helix repeat-containing protein [Nanoarchaeota archaeon]